MKRTHRIILRSILTILKDGKSHSYGELERKVNTNWRTIRDHCNDLELFDCVEIKQNKIIITEQGKKIFSRIK